MHSGFQPHGNGDLGLMKISDLARCPVIPTVGPITLKAHICARAKG